MRGFFHAMIGLALLSGSVAARTAPPTKPTLFLMSPEKKRCVWSTLLASKNLTKTLGSSPACPKQVLFDEDFSRAWFLDGKSVLEMEFGEEAAPKVVGKAVMDLAPIVDLYRDADTGELRLIGLDNGIQVRGNGQARRLAWEGREFKPFAMPYGSNAIAYIKTFKEGKWSVVAAASTRTAAEDTPGIEVIAKHIKRSPDSLSLRQILMSSTCAEQKCDERFPLSWNAKGIAARIGVAFNDNSKVGFFAFDDEEAIVAQVLINPGTKTIRLFSPPVFCRRKCAEIHSIRTQRSANTTISVDIRKDLALISDEGLGTAAVLFNQDREITPRLFPEQDVVFWLPD